MKRNHFPSRRLPAFTLTELLVSIAVALLLILGVNQVFKASSITAGAGQTLSDATRQSKTVKSVLGADFKGFASDGFLIIRSEAINANRNVSDPVPRTYRLDRMAFLARGNFARQTASTDPKYTQLTSATTSSEAMILYGPLALPNNDWLKGTNGLVFYNPGAAGSDNNRYASDWILGRVATLLKPFGPPTGDEPWLDIDTSNSTPNNMQPLSYSTRAPGTGGDYVYTHPIDVALTSINNYVKNQPVMVYDQANLANPANAVDWYNPIVGFDFLQITSPPQFGEFYRGASPFIPARSGTARITPTISNLMTPSLVRGCSHFIVEYAGNYTVQNNDPTQITRGGPGSVYGDVLGRGPDPDPRHTVDFIVDLDANGNAQDNSSPPLPTSARVRWYGFPRDVTGDGVIDYRRDVVPLRDLLAIAADSTGSKATGPMPFEKIEKIDGTNGIDLLRHNPLQSSGVPAFPNLNEGYATVLPAYPLALPPVSPGQAPYSYVCAWGPEMADLGLLPKMIRITIAIDDPAGRLGDAQVFEFVFDLQ